MFRKVKKSFWKKEKMLVTSIFSFSLNPLPDDEFQTSKLKEFAENNFEFEENGRKLSEWVENTVGKGQIACYEQFLLFPQRFQKACFPGASKGVIVWEWVNCFLKPSFSGLLMS